MAKIETQPDTTVSPRLTSPLPFVLPLVLFLLIASRYPDFASEEEPSAKLISTYWYVGMIALQLVMAVCLLLYFRKIYLTRFPFRISSLSVVVGAIGVLIWIGICSLQLEPRVLGFFGFDFSRPSFDPFTLQDSMAQTAFLFVRVLLLVVIVPLIEELFLRGWFVRWVEDPEWENLSLQGLSWRALLAASAYGVLTHPAEAIAAFVWFGVVSWLMNKTGSLWDCVVAHAVTNLLLGVYVLIFAQWHLW